MTNKSNVLTTDELILKKILKNLKCSFEDVTKHQNTGYKKNELYINK